MSYVMVEEVPDDKIVVPKAEVVEPFVELLHVHLIGSELVPFLLPLPTTIFFFVLHPFLPILRLHLVCHYHCPFVVVVVLVVLVVVAAVVPFANQGLT